MKSNRVPEFAVIGHPNEGKSAVVSTLSEDDSVRVSPYPGETLVCQTFPVSIDGREIIRFTDTPGFQNPKKILVWISQQMPVFEKFNCLIAFRTFYIKDCAGLPILGVLSGTFHR